MLLIRRIEGESMLPSLPPGALVFGLRRKRPKVGDVVVLRRDGRDLIKRIIHIKEHRYYVEGDNPKASTDSRTFGWVPQNALRAVIVGVIML